MNVSVIGDRFLRATGVAGAQVAFARLERRWLSSASCGSQVVSDGMRLRTADERADEQGMGTGPEMM